MSEDKRKRAQPLRVEHEEFVRVWQAAKSCEEVADHFGCKHHQAYHRARILRKLGVRLQTFTSGPTRLKDIPVDRLNQLIDGSESGDDRPLTDSDDDGLEYGGTRE